MKMSEKTAKSIGVIGGGQLAAMLADVCQAEATPCFVLDPDGQCPAVIAGASWVEGDSNNPAALAKLAAQSDVITVEIENINIDNLTQLAADGNQLIPSVEVLAKLVNKLEQKRNLAAANISTRPFEPVPAGEAVTQAPFGYPLVWKANRGGYDGRGVIILDAPPTEPFVPEVDGFIEAHVKDATELAVMVAVAQDGKLACWEPVEMAFTPSNTLDYLISPANVSLDIKVQALRLARDSIRALGGPGIFGVEMFLDGSGKLWVNEIAPRTHNSGHVTMDAAETSQFEQQHRLLTGLPLGSVWPVTLGAVKFDIVKNESEAVMFNLLGEPGYQGKTQVDKGCQSSGAHIHLYGKRECFPGRKMGHVTLTAKSVHAALQLMAQVRQQVKVRGKASIHG